MELRENGITWINVFNPTETELDTLQKTFGLHPVIVEELRGPSARSRVERYDSYIYLVYHFPIYNQKEKISERGEVDFVITKKAVITVYYDGVELFKEFSAMMNDEAVRVKVFENTLQLTYQIAQWLISYNRRQMRHVQEKVEDISQQLFKNHERDVLTKISYVKRDISEYRIIFRPQEHLLRSFIETAALFWGDASRIYTNDLVGDHMKITNQLEDFRMAVSDFEDTNNQLMNIKTTQAMKTFTTLSFMTFPFMLLAAVFAMNFSTPLSRQPAEFWIVVGIIAIGMMFMYIYFKRKDWL